MEVPEGRDPLVVVLVVWVVLVPVVLVALALADLLLEDRCARIRVLLRSLEGLLRRPGLK